MADSIEMSDRLSLLKSRLAIAKSYSQKKHKAWKKYIAEYEIEDFDDKDEVRDRVRIGYLFRKTESDMPAIFDDQPDIFIRGRNASAKKIEPLIDGTYDYLWDIQLLEEKFEDVGLYFILLGMGFIKSPYVTKTKKVTMMEDSPVLDELGQPVLDPMGQPMIQQLPKEYDVPEIDSPMAEVPDPFKLYFSPETKFGQVMDYDHCPYYFEEMVFTPEKIQAMFGKEVEAKETLKLDDDEVNKEMESETVVNKDDMKRTTVYEYYGCLPEEYAKGIKDAEGNEVRWTYDKDYHIYFTNNEELKVEENPWSTKPLFPIGNYGLANKFWKFGDAKHLMPLVQELQQYRSQILRHTRKMANPKPLVPESAKVDEAAFRDPREGRMVRYNGLTPPTYLQPGQLGKEVGEGIQLVTSDLEKTSGSFDLAGGSDQSSVKTPRGIQTYTEAADRNVRRKRKKIARLIRQVMMFQLTQVGKMWKPEDNKTIAIVNPDSGEEAVPVTEEVLQVLSGAGTLFQLDIEVESLAINKVQMKQDALDLFDLAKANPDVFNKVQMAKDLLQNGFGKKDADRYILTPEEQMRVMISSNPQLAGQVLMSLQQGQVPQLPTDQPAMPEQPAEAPQQEPTGLGPLPPIE